MKQLFEKNIYLMLILIFLKIELLSFVVSTKLSYRITDESLQDLSTKDFRS